jgi:hypothetical protein
MTAFPAFKRKQVASGLLGLNVNQEHVEFAFRTQQDRLNGVGPIQRVVHGGDPLRLYFMRSERDAAILILNRDPGLKKTNTPKEIWADASRLRVRSRQFGRASAPSGGTVRGAAVSGMRAKDGRSKQICRGTTYDRFRSSGSYSYTCNRRK